MLAERDLENLVAAQPPESSFLLTPLEFEVFLGLSRRMIYAVIGESGTPL